MNDSSQGQEPEVTDVPEDERRKNKDHAAYFNAQFEAEPLHVKPGGINASNKDDEMIVATVCTGVLLAVYDQDLKVGAMSYVLLPDALLDHFPFLDKADSKIVEKAFEPLENCIAEMKSRGAGKNRIKIRIFGGISREDDPDDRGLKNTVFVQEYLSRKGLPLFNADIGGPFIRRVHFFPTTGRAVRKLLKRESDYAELLAVEALFNKIMTQEA